MRRARVKLEKDYKDFGYLYLDLNSDNAVAYVVKDKHKATVFVDSQVPYMAEFIKTLTPEQLNGCTAKIESIF